MEFNAYIWQLYKESNQGAEVISTFANLFENFIHGKYIPTIGDKIFDPKSETWQISKAIIDDCLGVELKNISEAASLFEEIVSDLLLDEDGEVDPSFQSGDLLGFLPEISLGLYTSFPEFFFPYFFQSQFFLLNKICQIFNIPISELPSKRDFD